MEEIFRFQQLRQTQKLSEEQKLAVGLPLYPDENLSDFANNLIKAQTDDIYDEVIDIVRKKNNRKYVMEDVSDIHPSIRALYGWLNFKAKPIKKEDFKIFFEDLEQHQQIDLTKEWITYADNFILAI